VQGDVRNERFIEWLDGWLRARYVVLGAYVRDHGIEVVFVLEKDMFRLFEEMYRVVETMREMLHTDARVAICSGNECIDLTENRVETFIMLVSKYKIRKLEKVKNMIKRVLGDVSLFDMCINVVSNGGRVWIDTNCGTTTLYVDEAIAVSEMLISNVHAYAKLEILGKAAEMLFKMFNRADVDLSMVDIRATYGKLMITIGGCRLHLNYNRALKLAYELLEWSIIGLKRSLISVGEYGG
jgi:hypothetical protein